MEDAEPAAEPEPALAASVSAKGSSVDASGSLETRSRSRAVPAATGRSERYGAGGCSADALAAGQRAARALREAQGGARTILQRGRGGDEEELIGAFGGRVESLGADELELGGRHFRTRESSCGVSGWKARQDRSSAVRSCHHPSACQICDLPRTSRRSAITPLLRSRTVSRGGALSR